MSDRARHVIAIRRAMPHIKDVTLDEMDDKQLADTAAGCIGVAPRRQQRSPQLYQLFRVLPHGATTTAPRNAPCPCGSGKKTKKCHPVPT